MLASACGCCGPRLQVCPVLTSETAATTVPVREATYAAAAIPRGSWPEPGEDAGEAAGCSVPATGDRPLGPRAAGTVPAVAELAAG